MRDAGRICATVCALPSSKLRGVDFTDGDGVAANLLEVKVCKVTHNDPRSPRSAGRRFNLKPSRK